MSIHRFIHGTRLLSALVVVPATFLIGLFTSMGAFPSIVGAMLSVPLMGQYPQWRMPDYAWDGMKSKRNADITAEIIRNSREGTAQPNHEGIRVAREASALSSQGAKRSQLGSITLLVTGKYSSMSAEVMPDPAAAQLQKIFNASNVPMSALVLDDRVVFRALSTNISPGGGCNHSRQHDSAAMWTAPDSEVIGWGERKARSISGAAGTILVTEYDLSKRPGKMVFVSKCDQDVMISMQFIRPASGENNQEVVVSMLEAVRVARIR